MKHPHSPSARVTLPSFIAGLLYCMACLAELPADIPLYPVTVKEPKGSVVIHHPVMTGWRDFEVATAWVPVEVRLEGNDNHWMGSVKVEADTEVRSDERVVRLTNLRLVEATASDGLSPEALSLQSSPVPRELVKEAFSSGPRLISLEYFLRSLPEDFAQELIARPAPGLNPAPPRIIISKRPAQLMLIDGPPRKTSIDGIGLEYVVNTDWDVFYHRGSDRWYVINGGAWLENTQLAGGDWLVATELPGDFTTLALSSGGGNLQKIIPPQPPEFPPAAIIISYEPAELVVIEGEPRLVEIGDSELRYAANTESDLFELKGRYYLLLSGRWFMTRDLKRKWAPVTELPAEFSSIPADHPRAYVRVAVPGTEEARIALIEAVLPRTTELDASAGDSLQVNYSGDPAFVPIDGTELFRASNTPYQVFRHNNFYYLCLEGAWYRSAAAGGPWKAAVEVPQAIYTIPPTDPAYNVTFVRVDTFDDQSGKVAYKSSNGYLGTYTAGPTVVHGTGYYHNGANDRYRVYSSWYYHPYSYGYGARYHPAYGRYGYWGNPYPVHSSVTLPASIPERDWRWDGRGGKQAVSNRDIPNQVGEEAYRLNGSKPLQQGAVDATQSGVNVAARGDDIYASLDGTLFRRSTGNWQIYRDETWQPVSDSPPAEVLRQFEARQAGYQTYNDFLRMERSASE